MPDPALGTSVCGLCSVDMTLRALPALGAAIVRGLERKDGGQGSGTPQLFQPEQLCLGCFPY